MKNHERWAGGLLVAMAGAMGLAAADPSGVTAAEQSAMRWLMLVDTGKYAESWQDAAPMFKQRVMQMEFADSVRGARDPLGAVESRTLSGARERTSLPGAPDGDYVVMQFDTRFAHKSSAVETVTAARQSDGDWRVAGYFIR